MAQTQEEALIEPSARALIGDAIAERFEAAGVRCKTWTGPEFQEDMRYISATRYLVDEATGANTFRGLGVRIPAVATDAQRSAWMDAWASTVLSKDAPVLQEGDVMIIRDFSSDL